MLYNFSNGLTALNQYFRSLLQILTFAIKQAVLGITRTKIQIGDIIQKQMGIVSPVKARVTTIQRV